MNVSQKNTKNKTMPKNRFIFGIFCIVNKPVSKEIKMNEGIEAFRSKVMGDYDFLTEEGLELFEILISHFIQLVATKTESCLYKLFEYYELEMDDCDKYLPKDPNRENIIDYFKSASHAKFDKKFLANYCQE